MLGRFRAGGVKRNIAGTGHRFKEIAFTEQGSISEAINGLQRRGPAPGKECQARNVTIYRREIYAQQIRVRRAQGNEEVQ